MKKTLLTLTIAIVSCGAYAQNTYPYPASGNLGIGTTSPGNSLGFLNVDTDPASSGITWYNPAPYDYGIYRTGGAWAGPNYQQLALQWDTGISLNPGFQYGKSYVEVMGGGLRVTSGNVGIGTAAPTRSLSLQNGGTNTYMSFNTNGSEKWVVGDEITVGDRFVLYDTSNGLYRLSVLTNGNVGIGTTAPDARLAVAGTVHANEVKVDLSVPGPDYVFEPGYNLQPLDKLKRYLDLNHHLPEIPSAGEMAKSGLNLGELNTELLKKVEELTLYLIRQKERNDAQDKVNRQLQKQINRLKSAHQSTQ